MNALNPDVPATIVDQLREIARRQRLVERAIENMAAYVREADPDEKDWVFAFEDIRPEFGSQLRATPGNDFFPDWALGGYTTVLALATGADNFRQRVTEFWEGMGVDVEELDDVEPLRERADLDDLEDEFLELALSLSEGNPVVHQDTIHSYSSDEDDEDEEESPERVGE